MSTLRPYEPGAKRFVSGEPLIVVRVPEIPATYWESFKSAWLVGWCENGTWYEYSQGPVAWPLREREGGCRAETLKMHRDYSVLIPERLLHRSNEFGDVAP